MMLVDSNVFVAAIAETHDRHAPSFAFIEANVGRIALSAHSLSEAYNMLTRPAGRGFGLEPNLVSHALRTMRDRHRLIGLTPAQTLDAIGRFAGMGGIGPRLYDFLIGRAAVVHGWRTIVTWNVRDIHGLFPGLRVATPADAMSEG